MEPNPKDILSKQFNQLPKVVQQAITSAHVEERLRVLADKHKLHYDQWIGLENEIMLVLLGIQPIDQLAKNIAEEVSIPLESAQTIAQDASDTIFLPIEEELERVLANPDAKPKEESVDEAFRQQALAEARETEGTVQPETGKKVPPRSLEGDPYREPIS